MQSYAMAMPKRNLFCNLALRRQVLGARRRVHTSRCLFWHQDCKFAPVGVNWGGYKNPEVDALIDKAKQTFDSTKQDELLAQAHALIVDDATLVWVVHDTNPHALSPKVKQFVQAQHWFQDLTTIGTE